MDCVLIQRSAPAYCERRKTSFAEVHIVVFERDVVADAGDGVRLYLEGIAVNAAVVQCRKPGKGLLRSSENKALDMNLIVRSEAERCDAADAPVQAESFLLIHIPDRRLLINYIRKQLGVRFTRHALPDLNRIRSAAQSENRYGKHIRTEISEIDVAETEGCGAGIVTPGGYATLVAVRNRAG